MKLQSSSSHHVMPFLCIMNGMGCSVMPFKESSIKTNYMASHLPTFGLDCSYASVPVLNYAFSVQVFAMRNKQAVLASKGRF